MTKNNIHKIINEVLLEMIDPNGGNLFEPEGLNPKVVKLFENVEELYHSSLDDNYWKEVNINKFPDYNNPHSEDHENAINYVLNGMKNKYPDKNWNELENPMRKKISAGIS